MSKNIHQIFVANPITSNASTDLMYFGQSPYAAGNDAAMTYANFSAQFGPPYTPAALTRTNDTNVTVTLGGTPATALLQSVSLTLGWAGQLGETRGGTNQSTYTLGDILYASAANTLSKLAGNTTAVKQYLSQTGTGTVSAAPSWATISGGDITGAALTASNDTNVTLTLGGTPATSLLRAASITAGWTGQLAVGRGGTGSASFNTNGIVISGSTTTSALTSLSLTDGQVVIGSSIGAPDAATLSAGSGISITNGHNTISIAGTTNGLTYNDVSGTTQAAAVNNGYIISNAAQTTVTLPATAAEGSRVAVQGKGAAGWILAANTGQVIHLGSSASSTAGSLTSTNQWDTVTVVCVTANTTWAASCVIGTLTVV
jgi:hypothetical protein